MVQKKELVQFVVQNKTDCGFDVPLFALNVYSVNATTKYSWDVTTADLSCGYATIVINGIIYNITFDTTLTGLLLALNALSFGFFCSETVGSNTFVYTYDDTNVYGDLDICAIPTTTTSTSTTSTSTSTTSTSTSTTSTTTTAAPTTTTTSTSTTSTTTTAVPTTTTTSTSTSTTSTTTTAVPTTTTTSTSTTSTTTTAVPTTTTTSTSTTSTSTTDVPTTTTTSTSTSTTSTTTTAVPTTTTTSTSTTSTSTTDVPTTTTTSTSTSTTSTTTTAAPTTTTTSTSTSTTSTSTSTSTTSTTTTDIPTTTTTTSTSTSTTTLTPPPTTTSTTTSTTTIPILEWKLTNNISGDLDISGMEIGGTSVVVVIGAFPSTNSSSPLEGNTQLIPIPSTYNLRLVGVTCGLSGQSITVTDSNLVSQNQSIPNPYSGDITFTGVYVDGITQVQIVCNV